MASHFKNWSPFPLPYTRTAWRLSTRRLSLLQAAGTVSNCAKQGDTEPKINVLFSLALLGSCLAIFCKLLFLALYTYGVSTGREEGDTPKAERGTKKLCVRVIGSLKSSKTFWTSCRYHPDRKIALTKGITGREFLSPWRNIFSKPIKYVKQLHGICYYHSNKLKFEFQINFIIRGTNIFS